MLLSLSDLMVQFFKTFSKKIAGDIRVSVLKVLNFDAVDIATA